MMFFETCGHPIRAGRTRSMRSATWISACERGVPRRTPVAGCPTSMTTSAGRRRTWARWRLASRLRFTAQGAEQNLRCRPAKEADIVLLAGDPLLDVKAFSNVKYTIRTRLYSFGLVPGIPPTAVGGLLRSSLQERL